ncbi:hypothetical protein ABZ023_07105 [Streptomyces sp. NPDC006367]|uniref:hypothetical protein n=1 Tax=unclassified Streptomyces TaxID=2593676 RepID=UPI0033A407AE
MTERTRTMSPPVYLGMPLDPPAPVAHCPVCNEADRHREAARERGDLAAVTDANVVMRRHPHN